MVLSLLPHFEAFHILRETLERGWGQRLQEQ